MMNPETIKMLPQATDLEEAVIGGLMSDGRVIDECLSVLKSPDVFYKDENKFIFQAIFELYQANQDIDLLTVSQKLRELGKLEDVGGDFRLVEIQMKMTSAAHIQTHISILVQKMLRRKIIEFNTKITSLAFDEQNDVFELLSRWSAEFDKINEFVISGRSTIDFPEALRELGKRVERLTNKKTNEIDGIDTGFETLNLHTGGWNPGNLIVIGARPGMGKTAFVLRTALENVKRNIPVGMISLEMDVIELSARMVSIDTNFHLSQLLKKGFEKESYFSKYLEETSRMENYPFYVDDSAKSDLIDVVAQARLWKRMFGIELLIIDYLQLMTDRSKSNPYEEISTISRRMKLLAKELKIPIILLSQLSREVEKRHDKRPKLSDLRESGAIEQDADVVMFIYRSNYYGIEVDDIDMINNGTDSEIIFAKYRGGSVGTACLKWIGDKTKFVDPADDNDRKYFYSSLN